MNSQGLTNLDFCSSEIVKDDRSLLAMFVCVVIGACATFKLVMLAPFHYLQVAGVVVGSITINMMNNLGRVKVAP